MNRRPSSNNFNSNLRRSSGLANNYGNHRRSSELQNTNNTSSQQQISINDFSDINECNGSYLKFTREPTPDPKSVCIDIPNQDVTPKQILDNCLRFISEEKIIGIRFQNINAIINASDENSSRSNRYIITCEDVISRNKLVNKEFCFDAVPGKNFKVRVYDVAQMEDYKAFLRITKQTDKLQGIMLGATRLQASIATGI